MPETWKRLADDNRAAAIEALEHQRWRTSGSRAHYAAYGLLTGALLDAGVQMPAGRGNPHHARLTDLIVNNLYAIPNVATRWRLAAVIGKVYDLRVTADYRPDIDFDRDEAGLAIDLMTQVFQVLKG